MSNNAPDNRVNTTIWNMHKNLELQKYESIQ